MPPKFRKRVPNLRRKAAQISTVTVGVRIEIVLGEVLRIRRLGTSPQWNYFQRNSCKLTIKVVQDLESTTMEKLWRVSTMEKLWREMKRPLWKN
ncbi:hypothetical protein ACS0TY_013385 [Phlomoides rotata]